MAVLCRAGGMASVAVVLAPLTLLRHCCSMDLANGTLLGWGLLLLGTGQRSQWPCETAQGHAKLGDAILDGLEPSRTELDDDQQR